MPVRSRDNPPVCAACGCEDVVWITLGPDGNWWKCARCERRLTDAGIDIFSMQARKEARANRDELLRAVCQAQGEEADRARREQDERRAREWAERHRPLTLIEELRSIIASAQNDIGDAKAGSRAAADRVRKAMEAAGEAAERVRHAIPPWNDPPACSNCGSTRVAWILWGLPNFEDRALTEAVEAGRVILGGCCALPHTGWRCQDCAERQSTPDSEAGSSLPLHLLRGMFDPDESDAAKEARRQVEHAEWEARTRTERAECQEHRAREAAFLASPMGAYEYLKALIAEAAEDVRKAERGNKAAGVRVRRIMHDAKSAAQDVRNVILNTRDLPREDATPR